MIQRLILTGFALAAAFYACADGALYANTAYDRARWAEGYSSDAAFSPLHFRQALICRAERFLTSDAHCPDDALSRRIIILEGFAQLGFGLEDPYIQKHFAYLDKNIHGSSTQNAAWKSRFLQIKQRLIHQSDALPDDSNSVCCLSNLQRVLACISSDLPDDSFRNAAAFIKSMDFIPTGEERRIYGVCPTSIFSSVCYESVRSALMFQRQIRDGFRSNPGCPYNSVWQFQLVQAVSSSTPLRLAGVFTSYYGNAAVKSRLPGVVQTAESGRDIRSSRLNVLRI